MLIIKIQSARLKTIISISISLVMFISISFSQGIKLAFRTKEANSFLLSIDGLSINNRPANNCVALVSPGKHRLFVQFLGVDKGYEEIINISDENGEFLSRSYEFYKDYSNTYNLRILTTEYPKKTNRKDSLLTKQSNAPIEKPKVKIHHLEPCEQMNYGTAKIQNLSRHDCKCTLNRHELLTIHPGNQISLNLAPGKYLIEGECLTSEFGWYHIEDTFRIYRCETSRVMNLPFIGSNAVFHTK